jgi:hypothetical protein
MRRSALQSKNSFRLSRRALPTDSIAPKPVFLGLADPWSNPQSMALAKRIPAERFFQLGQHRSRDTEAIRPVASHAPPQTRFESTPPRFDTPEQTEPN